MGVSLVLFAAGSVDDFDLVKRTRLRTRVAAAADVTVEKVTLSVEAASVRLRFDVSSVEATALTALAASLAAALPSADAASTLLGVTVLMAPLLTIAGQSPLEESTGHIDSGGGKDSSLALPLAGASALLLASLILVVAVVLFRRAKR